MRFAVAAFAALFWTPGWALSENPSAFAQETKAHWKDEWDRTLNRAREEREVVVVGFSSSAVVQALTEFQKFYPEIKLILISGRGSQLGPRLVAERRASKYLADVYVAGTTTAVEVLVPAKAFDPIRPVLILPEVVDETLWFNKKFYFADPQGEHILINDGTAESSFIAYNTKLVQPEEFRSYLDLLNAKWKGKIVAHDPRRSGGGGGSTRFLYYSPKFGPNFLFRLFSEMDIRIGADERQMMDWLATGKYSLYLFPSSGDPAKAKQQGLPVDEITHIREGASMHSGAGGIALMNRAPHPNAAKLYINWFLSREGQTAWQKSNDRNSLRTDIRKDYISDWRSRVPKEGEDYIFLALPQYASRDPIRKVITEALRKAGKE